MAAFRSAVGHRGRDGKTIEDLRDAVQEFCARARREHMPIEQVLLGVKDALRGLTQLDGDSVEAKNSIRERLVTLAIETYYSDGARDGE